MFIYQYKISASFHIDTEVGLVVNITIHINLFNSVNVKTNKQLLGSPFYKGVDYKSIVFLARVLVLVYVKHKYDNGEGMISKHYG